MYEDSNNLHGWLMTQYLPGFKWLNQKEIKKLNVNLFSGNSSDGYILEVDLEHPDELHDLHNDYPLAPEKLEINYNIRSNYFNDIKISVLIS